MHHLSSLSSGTTMLVKLSRSSSKGPHLVSPETSLRFQTWFQPSQAADVEQARTLVLEETGQSSPSSFPIGPRLDPAQGPPPCSKLFQGASSSIMVSNSWNLLSNASVWPGDPEPVFTSTAGTSDFNSLPTEWDPAAWGTHSQTFLICLI